MADDWYYVENDQAVGPLSSLAILERLGKNTESPLLVWRAGQGEWADLRRSPQILAALQAEAARNYVRRESRPKKKFSGLSSPRASNLAARARHELVAYLAVSGYLLVWFSAILFYKATILHSVGVAFAPFGLAVVKALILGKFMLVLEALKIGESRDNKRLLVSILQKALLFTLLLFGLTILEEVIVGYFHGREARESLSEIADGSVMQALATATLMFLVLVPYLAFRQLAAVYGELPELWFLFRPSDKQASSEPNEAR